MTFPMFQNSHVVLESCSNTKKAFNKWQWNFNRSQIQLDDKKVEGCMVIAVVKNQKFVKVSENCDINIWGTDKELL